MVRLNLLFLCLAISLASNVVFAISPVEEKPAIKVPTPPPAEENSTTSNSKALTSPLKFPSDVPTPESNWIDVVGKTLQSFSEIFAVLIGSLLTIFISRGEHKRQREVSRQERRIDAAASVIESIDVIKVMGKEVAKKCTQIVETELLEQGAMGMIHLEAMHVEFIRISPKLSEALNKFRTSGLRYQLLSDNVPKTEEALEKSRDVDEAVGALLASKPDSVVEFARVVVENYSILDKLLPTVEKEIRGEILE